MGWPRISGNGFIIMPRCVPGYDNDSMTIDVLGSIRYTHGLE